MSWIKSILDLVLAWFRWNEKAPDRARKKYAEWRKGFDSRRLARKLAELREKDLHK